MQRRPELPRSGFTLIELVVALVIAGGALLLASAILGVTSQLAESVRVGVEETDERRGSERLVRRLVGQTTWATKDEPAPGGSHSALRWVSYCDSPEGWPQRCIVQLALIDAPDRLGIELILDGRVTQRLFRSDSILEFIYLRSPAHGGTWSERWTDPATIPAAVGIVFPTDTLILRTGERG